MPTQRKQQKLNIKQENIKMKFDALSHRECEILVQLSRGSCNKDIAATLNVTIHAVEKHLSNIYKKLGVKSRTEAVLWWFEKSTDFRN